MGPLPDPLKKTAVGQSWEYWSGRIGSLLPFGALAVAQLLAWIIPGQDGLQWVMTILLAALAAAWVYILYIRSPVPRSARPLRMLVYYAGFLLLAAALMSRQPIFFLFAITGFFHASDLRPWPLVFLGVGLTSILINTLITGFPWPERESWIFFGSLIVFQTLIIGFGNLLAEKLGQLNADRQEAIDRLQAALEENAGLQAQLVAQAREAGILEERQRLAREIHDTLAQGLIGVITQLGALEQAGSDGEARQRHLNQALRLARENLAEARRSVHALRPGPLAGAGLAEALEGVAQRWSQENGVPVQVTTSGDPVPLAPEAEAALLRTAQEALSNIARHARASRVGVTLSYLPPVVRLDVRDDGVGFDLSRQDRAGFGLTSMRQRLVEVGGVLEIETAPGEGVAISARVPAVLSHEEAARS